MTNNRCVIVYSLMWPEACAIMALYAMISPDTRVIICFSPEKLAEVLSENTTASVILGILPHESIFLLSRLRPHLHKRHVLFFGQRFNYVDKTTPFYFLVRDFKFLAWKNKTIMEIQEILFDFLNNYHYNSGDDYYRYIPLVEPNINELIYHINDYLYQMFSHYGVSQNSGKILLMLSYGLSTEKIANLLGICTKTVSVYKYNGLSLLGMETGNYNIHRGIFVRINLQQFEICEGKVRVIISQNKVECEDSHQ